MTRPLQLLALTAALFPLTLPSALAEDKPVAVFSRATADIGIVVSNIETSARFYTEVLGMTEVKGFSVSAEKAASFGLTDNQAASIRVFVLDAAPDIPKTRFKLMEFPDAPGKTPDQKFIHSSVGVSYLTLYVTDMAAAMKRLTTAKVKTLGKTPASIGGKNHLTVCKDPDGNFIELIGPMD